MWTQGGHVKLRTDSNSRSGLNVFEQREKMIENLPVVFRLEFFELKHTASVKVAFSKTVI